MEAAAEEREVVEGEAAYGREKDVEEEEVLLPLPEVDCLPPR